MSRREINRLIIVTWIAVIVGFTILSNIIEFSAIVSFCLALFSFIYGPISFYVFDTVIANIDSKHSMLPERRNS